MDGLELVKSLIHWHDEVITSLLSRVVHLDLAFFFYLKSHNSSIVILLRLMIIIPIIFSQANHDPKSGRPAPEAKIFADDELKNMIDPILDR